MLNLKARRAKAAFKNTQPTLTDQSAAATTDLNVIINQFLKTGQGGTSAIPRYGDFSELPTDLRGIIETSRSVTRLRGNLPEPLRDKPVEELLALTPEQLKAILQPPAKPPEEKKEEK